MKTQLSIFLAFSAALLTQDSLCASEEVEDKLDKAFTAKQVSDLSRQEVTDRLSQGMFRDRKFRIQLALAPATHEFLTEEFIRIVQILSQKMNIYEKCYIIRAVMKFPATQLTTLKDVLDVEQLQLAPNSERVSFIKKLSKMEPSQWQDELERIKLNK